jgi:predicted transposase/invertase (TIGR01784 family)
MDIMLPKIDFAFKLLFGDERNRDILTDFLKAVLPGLAEEEFAELAVGDPHLKREFANDKLEILDVKLRTGNGKSIDIEIQIADISGMRSRITYYLSNMITEQIGEGDYYDSLKQTIAIVITDYDFMPESQRFHTIFKMLETEEHFPFNDLTEIHALNLKRLPPEAQGRLAEWLHFIKAEKEEEFMTVVEKNPLIKEAYGRLQAMSRDGSSRALYEARLKAQRDEYARIQGALRQGREEGREEGEKAGLKKGRKEGEKAGLQKGREEGEKAGLQKGREEGEKAGLEKGHEKAIRKMVFELDRKGIGVNDIADVTHLSEREVSRILKEGSL